jgi:hypothetical protein
MVHFLRDNKNNTIIECEVTEDDLSSSVNLESYSEFLWNIEDYAILQEFISDMDSLNEIRGGWWEVENETGNRDMEQYVEDCFKEVADKWHLNYITD